MSNVVQFRQRRALPQSYPIVTTAIDPHSPLLVGDMVACYWLGKDGTPGEVMFSR